MTGPELEQAIADAWRNFMSAVLAKDPSVTEAWRKWQALRGERTEEQRARALVLAGLNADGTRRKEGG